MAKVIHLVRHGHHPLLGHTLCGRMAGVELDERGCAQVARCAQAIGPRPTMIQSSPQRRCVQSACILGAIYGLAVEIVPSLDELDYGDWTGQSFDALACDPRWAVWNGQRGTARPPGGEDMGALQRRIVGHLDQLRGDAGGGIVIAVSHAEPIRAALLHYQGIALDDFLSIEIEPGSVSTLVVVDGRVEIAGINQQVGA